MWPTSCSAFVCAVPTTVCWIRVAVTARCCAELLSGAPGWNPAKTIRRTRFTDLSWIPCRPRKLQTFAEPESLRPTSSARKRVPIRLSMPSSATRPIRAPSGLAGWKPRPRNRRSCPQSRMTRLYAEGCFRMSWRKDSEAGPASTPISLSAVPTSCAKAGDSVLSLPTAGSMWPLVQP